MVRVPLSRNIRFVEALAFLSLVFRGLASITTGHEALQPAFLVLLALTLSLMVAGLAIPPLRQASWMAILLCGLASVALQPFEADGLLWILASVFAMFHDGWFTKRPLVITVVAGGAVAGSQVLALVLHPADFVPLAFGIALADAALGFLIFTFRQDLIGASDEHRPVLWLADYALTDRELQVLQHVWKGRVAKEISFELGFSDSTIRKDLSSIYQKMGVIGIKELYVLSHSHRIEIDRKEEV